MKKFTLFKLLTLFTLLVTSFSFAQQANNSSEGTTVTRVNNGRQAVTSTFTDMTEFQDAYATVCSTSTLVAEDFSSFPPGTVVVCGPEN